MPNRVFDALLTEKIEIFRNAFRNTSKKVFWNEESKTLRHPGEYGYYREIACKDFIRFVIPRRLNIDHGFLMTGQDSISTQCDIIVYDSNSTPLIENSERQRFYPIETVVAVGEVKSTLNKGAYIEAINKLAIVKKMREQIREPIFVRRDFPGNFSPSDYAYDGIFTFIICEKLDFDLSEICSMTSKAYDSDLGQHHKHNMILSLEDGLMLYNLVEPQTNVNKCVPYPKLGFAELKNSFMRANSSLDHFKYFASYLFNGTSSSSTLFPEMGDYMHGLTIGELLIEK